MRNYSTRASRWADAYGQKFCEKHHFYYETECIRCKAEKEGKKK
jgi:hypothetical protein